MKLITDNIPKITIVTVTYNAGKFIAETIESVSRQNYSNLEYIIIDGASVDNTKEIVSRYDSIITIWKSEQDNGIYDAMNKAIEMATGEWILFLNAGDCFCQDGILSRVFICPVGKEYDFVYGDYIWKGNGIEQCIPSRPLELMWQRISFSHQSLFSRTQVMKKRKFNLKFRIVCDYDFYFSCYMEGRKFLKKDFPISVFIAGGVSDVHFFRRTYERWTVARRYKKGLEFHLYYLKLICAHYKGKYLKST